MSTINQLQAQVSSLGNISTSNAEPTSSQIVSWIRRNANRAIGEYPPIHEVEVQLSSGSLELPVTGAREIYFVEDNHKILLPSEWVRDSDSSTPGVRLVGYFLTDPRSLFTVSYSKDYDFGALDADTDMGLSCRFGEDWLEDYIVKLSLEDALRFMTRRHGAGGATTHGGLLRTTQDDLKEDRAGLKGRWDGWYQQMMVRIEERRVTQPPVRVNPIANLLVNSGYRGSRLAPSKRRTHRRI